jgi:uncharacterized membrane protein
MRISLKKYPIDIILCIIWGTVLLPTALLNIEGTVRVILGLPFILFIPGYILIFALFPTKKTDKGIDTIERIALSFGLSLAIVTFIGLVLNYTPWGIRLESILLLLFIFIIGIGFIAIYRWMKTNPNERFTISLEISLPNPEKKLDKALTIILVISIIISVTSLVYAIITPKTREKFTELYILGSEGMAKNYPKNLIIGEETSVILGILNHEYRKINYTIEVWLINQTTFYNKTTKENETITNHAWFLDKISVMLNHTPVDIEGLWTPQWEYNYTFRIDKEGENLKLAFLLFITPTKETYNYDTDYKDIIKEKINNAYRKTHLFITVL